MNNNVEGYQRLDESNWGHYDSKSTENIQASTFVIKELLKYSKYPLFVKKQDKIDIKDCAVAF